MGYTISVKVTLRDDLVLDTVKTAAKVKVEGVLAHWFHTLEHAVRGAFAKGALAALAHLTHVYTAYTVASYLNKWLNTNHQKRDALLRASVGNGIKSLTDICVELMPHGGLAFGWGEYFGDQLARVWLSGAFKTDPQGRLIDGVDLLPPGSRYRKSNLDRKVVPFYATVKRARM